ncbi:MAG: LicD family protein [Lachnospiraceae bacterium]|nr:LicD family protein [Lachnospiraceae bacterium]
MEFDNSFFEDEVREGFYIPGMIKRSWATQLDVLENVAKVCEKHGIKWFADCGTLIGAIRHHGFIPWDDDLDICMLRDDYEKFNRVAKAELPPKYRALNFKSEKEYNNFITRVVNHDVIDTSTEALESNHGFPYVSGIDIFPLDYLFTDENKENERRLRGKEVFEITEAFDSYVKELGPEGIIKKVENISGYRVDRSLPLLNALHRVLEKIFTEADSAEAKEVALMRFYIPKRHHRYPLEFYKESFEVPFENTRIRVPAAYEKILTIDYGNWAIANRVGGIHDYPFYSEQEKILASKRGGKVPYKYSYEPVEPRPESTENQIISLLESVHETLGALLEKSDFESAISILEKCQELAITLGTGLEQKYAERSGEAVGFLEKYCEAVFELSMKIQSGENVGKRDSTTLGDIMTDAVNELDKVKSTGNILFIVYKTKQWKRVKDLYYKAARKSGGNAYVMQVPFYLKDNSFRDAKEMTEQISLPSDVRTADYRTYDFGLNRPAEIVFTNPFDEYSSAEGIHPFFNSSNLRKLTDRLIYVSIIDATVPVDGDGKGWLTSKHYIISPGVVNADLVLVKDEKEAQMYRKVLTEAGVACEDAPKDMPAKRTRKPGPVIETKDYYWNESDTEDLKSAPSDSKKKMLFVPAIADFILDREGALGMIERALDTFNANREKLDVIWISDEAEEARLKETDPEAYGELRKAEESFTENGGIVRPECETKISVDECDAFYGAPGYAMNLCVLKGVPVMVRRISSK